MLDKDLHFVRITLSLVLCVWRRKQSFDKSRNKQRLGGDGTYVRRRVSLTRQGKK